MNEAFEQAIDDLDEDLLIKALSDFLEEQKLIGEFLMWLEKWKDLRRIK